MQMQTLKMQVGVIFQHRVGAPIRSRLRTCDALQHTGEESQFRPNKPLYAHSGGKDTRAAQPVAATVSRARLPACFRIIVLAYRCLLASQ